VRAAALLVVVATGLAPESFAAIYTCTDAQGHTVFRDVPCRDGGRLAETRAKRTRSSTEQEPAAEQALERSRVQGVLKRLHQAMTKRDAKAVVALLAEDAQVQWVLVQGKTGDPAVNRSGYADYLRVVFGRPDYIYERKSERVSLSKHKARATVTRSLREGVLVNGRLRVADVDERLTIEPDGRRLVVRSVKKTARIDAEEVPRRAADRPRYEDRTPG
jgi:hypothetical protein